MVTLRAAFGVISAWLIAPSLALAQPPGVMGGGTPGHGMMSSAARHHQAMMGNIPAPYASMRNPAPETTQILKRGAAVYAEKCAACHGASGNGEGEAGKGLSPPPANLAWLSQMPMSRWDAYMYWTIADGGQAFGTAMPAFKASLSQNDIWAVTSYIQHGLRTRAPTHKPKTSGPMHA
jgi:mono/diheme cytochrome c family protein